MVRVVDVDESLDIARLADGSWCVTFADNGFVLAKNLSSAEAWRFAGELEQSHLKARPLALIFFGAHFRRADHRLAVRDDVTLPRWHES